MFQTVYCIVFTDYVSVTYLNKQGSSSIQSGHLLLLALNLLVPSFCYDFYQLYTTGCRDYFTDMGNWLDIGFIVSGTTHVLLCLEAGPLSLGTKIAAITNNVCMIGKLFWFLRVSARLSPIVILVKRAITDMFTILIFFLFMNFFLGLPLQVLGLGLQGVPGGFRDKYGPPTGTLPTDLTMPGAEMS